MRLGTRFRPTVAFALGCATIVSVAAIGTLALLLGSDAATQIGAVATTFIVGAVAIGKDIVASEAPDG